MSPTLRRARIAGDGPGPGSSFYDQDKAGRPKVERNKHGCLTCRLRRKKCEQREFGEEPGPCHSCEDFRIECLGSGTKLPEWLKVAAEALRKEIKAHIRAKSADVLYFGEYYKGRSFQSHFPIPRVGNTSSSSDGNSDTEYPVNSRDSQLDVPMGVSPSTSPSSPYTNWPIDEAFPEAGSVEEKQHWLLQRPQIVEAARTLFIVPPSLPPPPPQYLAYHDPTAAQFDEFFVFPSNDVQATAMSGAETSSGLATYAQLTAAEQAQYN